MAQDEVYENAPGICPVCGMELIPVRLDLAYTCPNHAAVIQGEPGFCPIDTRELVLVTVAIHWACDGSRQHYTEPGTCAGGSERELVRELRAHGDHNPRHGGMLFMAADRWHHLEGTYPGENDFRMYFFDNFTQPIDSEGISGRVAVLSDANEEIASFPMLASSDGQTMAAQLENGSLPLRVAALVKFEPDKPEQRFDFRFGEYSVEPPTAPPAAPPTSRPPAPAAAPLLAPSAPSVGAPSITVDNIGDCMTMSRTDASAMSRALPDTPPQLLELLNVCSNQVSNLIQSGEFGFIYIPTMLSKDIALALEDHIDDLPRSEHVQARRAVRRLVLTAWQVDYYGDIGNRQKLAEAFVPFVAAVEQLRTFYGEQQ